MNEMTSRQAAQKILDAITEIIGFYQEDVDTARQAGSEDLAKRYEVSVDTLAVLASEEGFIGCRSSERGLSSRLR